MSYLYGMGQLRTGLMVASRPRTGLSVARRSRGAMELLKGKRKKKKKKKKRKSPVHEVAPVKKEAPRAQREPVKIRKERKKPPVKEVLPTYKRPVAAPEPRAPRQPEPRKSPIPADESLPAFAETQRAEKAPAPKPATRTVYTGGGGAAYKPPARALPSVSFTPSAPFDPAIPEEKPFPWVWVAAGGAALAVAWMVLK